MPYAPPQLVLDAVTALLGAHPLAIVTVPALLRAAQAAGADPIADGVPFGATEERALLDDFFVLPRPPDVDRPYRAPWSDREPWQKKRYADGTLQRLRTDHNARGSVVLQTKRDTVAGRPRDVWRLSPSAGADLLRLQPSAGGGGNRSIRIVDLALWMGRNRDVADLDELLAWFSAEFEPHRGDLLDTIYSDDVPAAYRAVVFGGEPVDDFAAEVLGSLPAAPVVSDSLDTLVSRLEQRISRDGYALPKGLVRRVLTAWLRGDLVVLVGQPGTGKTMFANLLGRSMEKELGLDAPLMIAVRADFDEAEFIGYERLDGKPQLREFATTVLQSDAPLDARVVILEEFNLASVELYLSSILVAAQERSRLVRLPAGVQSHLPIDTFIIATCNSYRDEPETRTRVSAPTKRRSTIITMPNVLADRYDEAPDHAVLDLALDLVRTEASGVTARTASHSAVRFDSLRSSALDSVATLDDLSVAVRDRLKAIGSALLDTPAGRSWFTLGILRDIALAVALAAREESAELTALGHAVADKLVHQLRGSHSDVEELLEICADLPNAVEVRHLIDRVMDGPADELLPLL